MNDYRRSRDGNNGNRIRNSYCCYSMEENDMQMPPQMPIPSQSNMGNQLPPNRNQPAQPREGEAGLPTPSIPPNRNQPAQPGEGGVGLPTPMLPPNMNQPAQPGEGGAGLPTPSLPPSVGVPEIPLPPIIGQPEMPTPIPLPSQPSNNQRFARVRALNAVANFGELALTVGDVVISSSFAYGTSTQYFNVPDGFRVVTVTNASFPRRIIFRQVIPFVANTRVTLALINTSNGIGIQVVPDMRCVTMAAQLSCLRMVNLSFNSNALDLALEDGRIIFSDVRFREVTPFKRARPSKYDFVVINSPNRPVPIVSDIVLINDLTNRINGNWRPLLRFSIDMKANTMYTVYIIGNDGYVPRLQPYILES